MGIILKKELGHYLNNPLGYIATVLFAVFANFLFVKDIFLTDSASLKPFFGMVPWLLLLFVPALAMRALSEEKRQNTMEVLLTLPISETQIVFGKFFSIMLLVSIALLLTLGLPVSLSFLSRLYLPEILTGYLGLMLLGSLLAGLSLFVSGLTRNQIIAFLVSAIAIFMLYVLNTEFFLTVVPRTVADFLALFSPLYHVDSFVKGIVDLRSLVFFASFTTVFLVLTIITLEKRD